MVWFKSCPVCQGDLHKGIDQYGWYIACLQCGRYLGEAESQGLHRPASVPVNKKKSARRRLSRAA